MTRFPDTVPTRTLARPGVIAIAVAMLALVAVTVASLWAVQPPNPAPVSAPEDQFSAGRAFEHVQRVGQRVHVAGSEAAAQVEEYLYDTLSELGLRTEVQEATGGTAAFGGVYGMAHVRNVVALLPGTDPTGRVFLVAHYDSVQVSYGGNDDGAGVGTLLETARALAAGPAPRNDVVFVFTDAEEACLCGAEAFVDSHRYARDGGVVLNFEARGSSGPVVMFETSSGNANLIGVYGDAAKHPVATSFAVEVYRILPNDTDFTPFLDAERFTGLNAAYLDGSAAYHTPEDKPSTMDRGSLQMHGDNALALAKAFAAADLTDLSTPAGGDQTYFPVLGLLVQYPGSLVWPLAALALIAVGALAYLARRRRLTTWPRALGGIGLGLAPLLLAPVAAQLLWMLLVAIRPQYAPMLDPWRPGWFRLAVVALVATVLLAWHGLLRRRLGPWSLILGGLSWLAILGLALAYLTPGGSYLAAVPALAMALGGIVALTASRAWVGVLALTVGAAVSATVLAPTVLLFFPAMGMETGGAAAFFAILLGLAVLPLLENLFPPVPTMDDPLWTLERSPRYRILASLPGAAAAVLAVACVGVGLNVDRFDEQHPAPAQLMYALDADTGRATWVSAESAPGEWTSQYVDAPQDLSQTFPVFGDEPIAAGAAQAADLPAPELVVVADTTNAAGERSLVMKVKPQRDVRLVYLQVTGAVVAKAIVDYRRVPLESGGGDTVFASDGSTVVGVSDFALVFHAPPEAGLDVRLTLAAGGSATEPVTIRVMDGSDGLDGLPGFVPRPPGVGVEGSHDSELVVVAKTYELPPVGS